MTRLALRLLTLSLLMTSLLAPGCAVLSTWERATLNSRVMFDSGSPGEAAIEEHVHAIRESAQGATTAAGSSCGCN